MTTPNPPHVSEADDPFTLEKSLVFLRQAAERDWAIAKPDDPRSMAWCAKGHLRTVLAAYDRLTTAPGDAEDAANWRAVRELVRVAYDWPIGGRKFARLTHDLTNIPYIDDMTPDQFADALRGRTDGVR